ncbi:hypothetical protein RJP21_30065 [Paenibacillus sp. VCA1]|uniref:hypothetical protein n=1 Tax=Paenibacillus sp. VCA1 TaxID=3039148 RepID=UPI002870D56C|nr:hypothetical protein [Paenibacillus sp. VCA1]MDR9857842.1 hypothetical protein [Paenibacillus sp. VCA1]
MKDFPLSLGGIGAGILMQVIALGLYNATPAEGFIAYLIGYMFGWLLIKEVRNIR